MSGLVDGTGGAVAAKIFAGILIASSIAAGGAAAAETGPQEESLHGPPSNRGPVVTDADRAAWAQEMKAPCAPTFWERLAATRSVLRSYPAAVRDYERQTPWYVSHCRLDEAQTGPGTSTFPCTSLDGHPPDLTVLGFDAVTTHEFMVVRATLPPLGVSETLRRENARCYSRDPVPLSVGPVRPRADGWQVPKLARELKALVPSDPHSVPVQTILNLVYEVGQRVPVIEILCFASKTAACSDARGLLRATAATRTEMQRIEDQQRSRHHKAVAPRGRGTNPGDPSNGAEVVASGFNHGP